MADNHQLKLCGDLSFAAIGCFVATGKKVNQAIDQLQKTRDEDLK